MAEPPDYAIIDAITGLGWNLCSMEGLPMTHGMTVWRDDGIIRDEIFLVGPNLTVKPSDAITVTTNNGGESVTMTWRELARHRG